MISVLTTVDLRFEYFRYFGSQLGEYIPEICVEPVLTDPAEYYVKGWEGFFNIIGTTTITTDIILRQYFPSESSVIFTFEVTLNSTHRKPCFTIEYSNIASFVDDYRFFILQLFNCSSRLFALLDVFSSCKSLVIMHV